ncbi:MAG: alpha/beta hydrolase [Erysipelotrichaceae bacterium]|nr:alpha/beta hydrolase [Erysipelotrichaceae bacterium]
MLGLNEKTVSSSRGSTYYWTNEIKSAVSLVFLPGLTADHRLFEPQLLFFKEDYKVLVWDCPCHGKSRPYETFSYANISEELNRILETECVDQAVFIGQSLGGMIAQYYIDQHPARAAGLISVDSVPFGDYYSKSDMFWLSQLEWMCRMFPDKLLRSSMAKICGATEAARKRMHAMLSSYTKSELCHLMYVGEAAFIPENKKIDIPCRTILLLGEKDKVGKVAAYNREWSKRTGFPLILIQGAAHNANDDQPDMVNGIILDFIKNQQIKTKG